MIQEVNRKRMSNMELTENERKINDYIARKSRIVTTKEFEGNGKVLVFNSNRVNPNANGKFGPVIEYTVKELSGVERVVNASAVSLISGLQSRLKEKSPGIDVKLLVRKTGVGTDTRYNVEHAN
jgi:hypothetical protein